MHAHGNGLTSIFRLAVDLAEVVPGLVRQRVALPEEVLLHVQGRLQEVVFRHPVVELGRHPVDRVLAEPVHRGLGRG